ncbi:MAG: c-type cytochrome [Phycisphaerae bacterium]
MRARARLRNGVTFGVGLSLLFTVGCPFLVPIEPPEFTNADGVRGGLLYDKWWTVANVAEPTSDHPLWATRPDTESNTRTGSTTWRCKECHGWDYKGVDGAYATGSHRTGFSGIFGTTKTAQETFDLIKTAHGFGSAGLSDTDIWDLAKFVKEGQIDTGTVIAANGNFIGSETNGQTLYDNGVGSNTSCATCHGADGATINFKTPPDEEFLGDLARENPWETLHKIRFGQPGTAMPSAIEGGGSTQDAADIGTYAQTLEKEEDGAGNGGDATAGQAFFTNNNCSACHGADASGGFGPSLIGKTAAEILKKLDGTESHTGGTVDGVTQQDADNLAAWLATL